MTSPLAHFKGVLASGAASALGLSAEAAEAAERQIRLPEPERGDLALPCFELARLAKQNPPNTARQVATALSGRPPFSKVEAAGPYVNVTIDPGELAKAIVPRARSASYGSSDRGKDKTVVIDFSSPNIAKPLAFHHIRSTVIGAAIGRIHEKLGYRVVGINYLGDWGKQFGLLATGFQRYGDPSRRGDAKHLVEVYVKANKEADVDARRAAIALPAEARKLSVDLATAERDLGLVTDEKAKKAAEKKVKGLEKKVRAMRGLDESADPSAGLEAWFAELDRAKAQAEVELPLAEERDREARLFFKRLEEGEASAVAEWREFREASIAEFLRVYARMGIAFQSIEGESFYTKVLEKTVDRVKEKPGTKLSDGALIVDLPYKEGEPPILLKTRDGTTLYITRDIAAAIDRFERFSFSRSLYVVAQDQALHFQQLIRTLKEMGFAWADDITHVSFGRVHGMSTRRGNVVFLDEVLDEAVAKAREKCEQSERIDRALLDQTVEAIGVGAVVFGDLKNLRTSDYTFKLDEVVNFDGLTGPYVQYTHARASSILRKGGGAPAEADLGLLSLEEERAVLRALARVPEAISEACDALEPSFLTRAILDLSQAISTYLTSGNKDREKRVLLEDNAELRASRLALMDAARNTLAIGLTTLGLRAPEAM
jgi:arginyl-tRNA synthetase